MRRLCRVNLSGEELDYGAGRPVSVLGGWEDCGDRCCEGGPSHMDALRSCPVWLEIQALRISNHHYVNFSELSGVRAR